MQFSLTSLIYVCVTSLLMFSVMSILFRSNYKVRYVLRDRDGYISAPLFVTRTIHKPTDSIEIYLKLIKDVVTGTLAVLVIAAVITGVFSNALNELDHSKVLLILFTWYAVMQLKGVLSRYLVLTTIADAKIKTIKVDDRIHHLTEVDRLPWAMRFRFTAGILSLAVVIMFVAIF